MPLSAETTIIIPCCNASTTDAIKQYGLFIAKAFDATITFLIPDDDNLLAELKQKLHEQISPFISDQTFRFIQSDSLSPTQSVMEKNHNNEEVIMVMYPEFPHRFQSQIKWINRSRRLKLPFIVLPQSSPKEWKPQHVIMPVSYDKNDKEAAIWVSYWGRFNNSRITLLAATEKYHEAETNVARNILFIKKLFESLKLTFEIKKGTASSARIAEEAIESAAQEGNSLVAITTTKYYSITDYFMGPKELHLIKNEQQVPIFCINPRKDLYVLCR
ncbi:hypothetical protein ACT3CD_06665 [Geofilum sp. OHC36d9]|uniref:hypothetical protein n=1 Tax=Geofilum sp. OHC36d9 TaxID=3458413 RepID=UPI00403361FD